MAQLLLDVRVSLDVQYVVPGHFAANDGGSRVGGGAWRWQMSRHGGGRVFAGFMGEKTVSNRVWQ